MPRRTGAQVCRRSRREIPAAEREAIRAKHAAGAKAVELAVQHALHRRTIEKIVRPTDKVAVAGPSRCRRAIPAAANAASGQALGPRVKARLWSAKWYRLNQAAFADGMRRAHPELIPECAAIYPPKPQATQRESGGFAEAEAS